MTSHIDISPSQLSRLVGLPGAPSIIDVRMAEDYAKDPRLLPKSYRRDFQTVTQWASQFAGQHVVVMCEQGLKLSQGVSAWLRYHGVEAETLGDGFQAWRDAQGLLISTAQLPQRDSLGRTIWVTRARPKVDRIACPRLIRRFVDPDAVFLYVSASEVKAIAEKFQAMPFDIEDVFWSHRGDTCTFDTMLSETHHWPAPKAT